MLFTVTDKKGRFVTDLTKDDFEVIENKKPQDIQEFTAETDLPLRLGILIDTSNSIRDRFKFEQEAASCVHPQRDARATSDKAMVVSFDTSAELVADLIDDTEQTRSGDSRPAPRRRHGTLRCASYFACRDKLSQDQPRHKFRRAIVIVSDGDDNQSRYTRDQALEMAQKADVVIYAISTNITRVETDGDKVLRYSRDGDRRPGFLSRSRWRTWSSRSRTSPTNCATSTTSSTVRSRLKTDGLFHPVALAGEGPQGADGAGAPGILRAEDVTG